MTLPIIMADSAEPQNIPAAYSMRSNGVAAYYDGDCAWSPAQLARWPRYWLITVRGDSAAAERCCVIDVENGDATPGDVADYHDYRDADSAWTIVYCDRSTVASVLAVTPHWGELFWWISAPGGAQWTPLAMATDLAQNWNAAIDPGHIAAVQNEWLGYYDSSQVFLDPRWQTR